MMNVCGERMDNYQINDNYACRVGKGQYKALEQAVSYHRISKWFVKMDVRKYFDNIDHVVLKALMRRLFDDERTLSLFDKIIDSYFTGMDHTTDKEVLMGKGVPIGNLTSQYFANHYLAYSDHYIKQALGIKRYVRYMDDMVIWGDDKDKLLAQSKEIQNFLREKLLLDLKEICHNSTSVGAPFLGYRIMNDRLRLLPNSKRRYSRKMKEYKAMYESGLWSEPVYMSHVMPATSFVQKADSADFLRNILNKHEINYE
jgi:retron-type reverse transcriptase